MALNIGNVLGSDDIIIIDKVELQIVHRGIIQLDKAVVSSVYIQIRVLSFSYFFIAQYISKFKFYFSQIFLNFRALSPPLKQSRTPNLKWYGSGHKQK